MRWCPKLQPVDKSDSGTIEKQQGTHHECREAHDEKDQFQFAQRKQRETIALISELGNESGLLRRVGEGPLSRRCAGGSSPTLSKPCVQGNQHLSTIAYC